MWRLIPLIIRVVLFFLGIRSLRSGYGYDNELEVMRANASRRRRNALRKCKKFLSNLDKKVYILKNENVKFVFDSKKETMFCLNVHNPKQSAFLEWKKQLNFITEDIYENTFERVFDSICVSFNENANYGGILRVLKDNFNNIQETSNKTEKIKTNPKAPSNVKKLNINNLSDKELSILPGINIATAKKIIQRINLKGDYTSVEDMYKEMKIKEHFQMQLNDLICAETVKKENSKPDNDDRIIDL